MRNIVEELTGHAKAVKILMVLMVLNILFNIGSIVTTKREVSGNYFEKTCLKYNLVEKYSNNGSYLQFSNGVAFRVRTRNKSIRDIYASLKRIKG